MTDTLERTEIEARIASETDAPKLETIDLKNKRIVVTGGTTGIGRATVRLLAAQGAKLFVIGRKQESLDETKALDPAHIDGTTGDVAKQEDIESTFRKAAETLGGIDIAIVAAGLPGGGMSDMSAKDARYMLDVNFTAEAMCAHAAYQYMEEGDIVLIGSTSAHDLTPGSTVYAGAKAGVAGFAEALRRELGPKGVRVTLIEPGLTGTDLHGPGCDRDRQEKMIEAEEMLKAEDIATAIHFALTRPRRAVVQSISVVPRNSEE